MKLVLRFLHPILFFLTMFGVLVSIVLAAFVVLVMANFATVWSTLIVAGLLVFSTFYLIKWIIMVWVYYEDQRS